MPFDPLIVGNPALLSGNVGFLILKTAEPLAPSTIIETDDNWEVDVNWNIQGLVAPALGGDWDVKLFLESMDGLNPTKQVGNAKVSLGSVPPSNNRKYTAKIKIAAGTVGAGLYKLTAAITYSNLGVVLEMAGFHEGPLMQFIDPGPFDTP
jgi:hypothetical protein